MPPSAPWLGPRGEQSQGTDLMEGTTGGKGQAPGPQSPCQGKKGHSEWPAALLAGWKGPAIRNIDQWRTGKHGGGDTPGHSPLARGAQVFLGSQSLQVNPEKGTTWKRSVWPLWSIRAFSPMPCLALSKASGSDEDTQRQIHLRASECPY